MPHNAPDALLAHSRPLPPGVEKAPQVPYSSLMAPRPFLGRAAGALRKSYGIRRADMAAALSVTPRWVSAIETGERQPSIETAALYARRLGVALDALLGPVPARTEEAA